MSDKEHSVNKAVSISPSNDYIFDDNSKSLRADAKQNLEKILDAAYKIFAEKGLSIPISEIAREAGVGIGTVYRHFPNKEALFKAVTISYKQQLTEMAKSLANTPDPGKSFFDFFTFIMEDGFTNKILKDALKRSTFSTRMTNSNVLKDFKSACATLLTRAQQVKEVREDVDVKDLISLMTGILLSVEQDKVNSDKNRFNRLITIVCDGLRY